MPSDDNPYQSPSNAPPQPVRPPGVVLTRDVVRVFRYSYITSVVVAFTVVVIWLGKMISEIPPGNRRSVPDVAELMFLFLTTAPSIVTCSFFSLGYCYLVRNPADRRMWSAILFGALSGLSFNAMTAITTIEYFFDW